MFSTQGEIGVLGVFYMRGDRCFRCFLHEGR